MSTTETHDARRLSRRNLLGTVALGTGAAALSPRRAAAAPLTLRYANSVPAGYPHSVRMQEAAERIGRDSNGEVQLQVYPASQLGSDTDLLSQVRSGAIDLISISSVIIATLVPAASLHGVGFAWSDDSRVWEAVDGELGAYVRAQIAKANLHTFEIIFDSGFRQITSGTRPVATPDDLKGFKIRVPVSPLWISLFRALNAAPVSLNFNEVYTSLQTHVVDGQENALALVDTAKLYEVQKFVSLTNHMWDGNWCMANGRLWQGLPGDVRTLLSRHIRQAALDSRQDVLRQNAGLETALVVKGLTFNKVDSAPFRDKLKAAGFYKEWQGRFGSDPWALLERYAGSIS